MSMLYPKRKIRKMIADGEYIEAIALGKELETKYENDHDFMFIMGSTYFMVEDAQKALEYFEKALSLKSDDVETLKLKTNAHLMLGQKEKATIATSQILEIDPNDFEAQALFDELQGV